MTIEFKKDFLDSVLLHSFLEVNAPDLLIKNAFWHDVNGNPIDCNIYHPKYGSIDVNNKYGKYNVRLGFLTTSKDYIISSCSYSYKSCNTNETVYCQFKPLQLLCIDENGCLTNRDGITIKKVDYTQTNQKRQALDGNDFAEIYEREFLSSKLLDTKIHHMVFKDQLTKYVNKLIAYHEDNREYGRTLDIEIIAKANEFLSWLPNYEMPPLIIDGILFNAELVYQIHKQYNNIIFLNLSEKQLFDALNNPKEFGGLIKMKPDKKGKLTGLIKHLEDLCKSKDWRNQIIEKIEYIDIKFYQKKSNKEVESIKLD